MNCSGREALLVCGIVSSLLYGVIIGAIPAPTLERARPTRYAIKPTPAAHNIKSARTCNRMAAEPAMNAHSTGINATARGHGGSAANNNPMVRRVVGQGTPKVGASGNR